MESNKELSELTQFTDEPRSFLRDKDMKSILIGFLYFFGVTASLFLLIIVVILNVYGSVLTALIKPFFTAEIIVAAIGKMQHWIDKKAEIRNE